MATAWFVLALGDDREHAGNDGYDDNPAERYSWDSTVPNHAQIAVGDRIVLWDKEGLIGYSVIEAVVTGTVMKKLYYCGECGRAGGLKRRLRDRPVFRCSKCLAVFDVPASKVEPVTTYESVHGEAWVDCRGLLSAAEVRALCDSPKSQLSMRRAKWETLRDALSETSPAESTVEPPSERAGVLPGGHRVMTVRTRIGQDSFRKELLRQHGERCAITGNTPAAALEAAHLYSYAESGEHHEHGGLLLRRDLHRLFDLGYVAVDPETGKLDISKAVREYPLYGDLHGCELRVALRPEHREWLGVHWAKHRGADKPRA
ncbi:HNH endonuclease [Streptomyces sp. NPDC013489]|uniref:HNH endonuclease n=1 Tax=Streptomyces sp. NPDC013489 TaxID=3155606 RepID=UPI003410276D